MSYDVIVVGAGFTGLTAALELSEKGKKVLVLDPDSVPGGLAGTAAFRNGVVVEKFYHHWFNHDEYVTALVERLGLKNRMVVNDSRTGMYYNKQMWRLSKPMDLLRFTALPFWDRIRLGLLVFRVRRVKDWKALEKYSIREWLEPLCGKNVYKVVWEPLVNAKFNIFAERINAVWMWGKLVVRGSSRGKGGKEQLAYFRGGFGKLAEAMADRITANGSTILYNTPATGIRRDGERIAAVLSGTQSFEASNVLITTAFPIAADLLEGTVDPAWLAKLRQVNYLANLCLVLQLDRSLSDTYWLNVNDPGFPFVGVIEHTNFDPPENYKNTHIVYLSRYLAKTDPVWTYDDERYYDYALQHLAQMFPDFRRDWVLDHYIWRADYAQPIPERDYSRTMPGHETPLTNCHLYNMAQIYPEDRGTNFAIRDGLQAAKAIES
jgi:protoporphyrinogen oxidase